MLKFLRHNDSLVLLIAPVLLLIGMIIKVFVIPAPELELSLFPLADNLFDLDFLNRWPILNMSLSLLFALVDFIFFNRMVQQQGLLGRLTNLPLMVAVLLFFMLPPAFNSVVLWICLLLFIFFISDCIDIVNGYYLELNVFNTAFVAGLLGLLCPLFLVSWTAIILALFFIGAQSVKRLLIAVVGLALPFYLVWSVLYLLNIETIPLSELFAFDRVMSNFSVGDATVVLCFIILVIVSLTISNISLFASSTIREKRKWNIIGTLFVLTVVVTAFVNVSLIPAISFLPAVIILSNVLAVHANKWVTEPLFLSLIVLAVLMNVL